MNFANSIVPASSDLNTFRQKTHTPGSAKLHCPLRAQCALTSRILPAVIIDRNDTARTLRIVMMLRTRSYGRRRFTAQNVMPLCRVESSCSLCRRLYPVSLQVRTVEPQCKHWGLVGSNPMLTQLQGLHEKRLGLDKPFWGFKMRLSGFINAHATCEYVRPLAAKACGACVSRFGVRFATASVYIAAQHQVPAVPT